MARLILKVKGRVAKAYQLERFPTHIGRDRSNDIRIEMMSISRRHAVITKQGEAYFIEDLNSTNGTFVNRKRIVRARLYHMDEVTLANQTLIFEAPSHVRGRAGKKASKTLKTEELIAFRQNGAKKEKKKSRRDTTEEIENLASLTFLSGGEEEPEELMLVKKLTSIGAHEDADIRLKGPRVPKVAALVEKKSTGYSIIPSEEGFKVRVNGREIAGKKELADGDIIEVGPLKFLFSME